MKNSLPKTHRTPARRAWLWALIGGLPLAGFVSWTAPQESEAQLDEARLSLEQLYETRRLISQERNTWKVAKELMASEIEVAQDELAKVVEDIAAKSKESEDNEAQVKELLEAAEASTLASTEMVERLPAWEARLRTMIPRLPQPLQEEIRSLTQSLPKEGEDPKLTPSKRFITVVFLLTQINKFHGEVHTASETLTMPDGTQVNVSTLYLGVSQGYYVSQDGKNAGVGRSSESGWDWTSKPDSAAEIAKAIAILESEAPAGYASLPLTIQ